MTTLRNIVGGMDLEQTLTSRDEINSGLRGVLDEATGKWGIRVNRVELKGIDPPPSIKDSMEKQMRADRDKRAAILTAEGQRQSAILTAEGSKQSAILNAEGDREALILRAQADRESRILRAQGEGQAIQTVFQAIHDGQPDQSLLAYQYLQMMPKIAEGDANKVWIVPERDRPRPSRASARTIDEIAGHPATRSTGPRKRVDMGPHRAGDARRPGPTTPSWPRPTRRSRTRSPRPSARPTARPRRRRRPPRCRRTAPPPTDARRTPVRRRRSPGSRPRSDPARRWWRSSSRGSPPAPSTPWWGRERWSRSRPCSRSAYPPVTANVSNTIGLVPGSLSGAIGYRRELDGQRDRGCSGSAPPRCSAASSARCCCCVLPASAFEAIVPVLIVLGCVLVVAPAADQPPGRRPRRAARHRAAEHGAGWVWPRVRSPACTAATSAPPRACC